MSIDDLWPADPHLRAEVARLRLHLSRAIEMLQIMQEELQAAHDDLAARSQDESRASSRQTAIADHALPCGVATWRAVNSAAICRRLMPSAFSSRAIGSTRAARSSAFALLADAAAAWNAPGGVLALPSFLVGLHPPSRCPRALAAASATLVRALICAASCSATAARMCSVNRVACGLSTGPC